MRARAAGFVGVTVLATLIMAPGAHASVPGQSTSCTLSAHLRFKPGLEQGMNRFAFFTFNVKLDGCVGGGVSSAYGHGGSAGDLECDSGSILGDSSAKAMLFWDT